MTTDEQSGANGPRKRGTNAPRRPLPPPGTGKNERVAMKKSAAKRNIGIVVALAALGAGTFAYSKLGSIAGKNGGGAAGVIESLRNPRSQFPDKNRVTVLLLGKDYNRDKKGMPYTKGARADSIMLLSLDLEKQTVSALSIPRDTRVTAPDHKTGKINATYARGGEKLIRETVADLLGVAPDYYIALKPDAVKALVDSLGGVEVESIDAMNYDDDWGQLHVHLPEGKQTVDGTQAVGFARFREIKPGTPHSKEEGDPRRMARQQQLIRAMVAKGKSPSNWLNIDDIVNTGFEQVETDLTRQQVFALASLFRGASPDMMQSATLPGHGTMRGHGPYFYVLDDRKKQALVDWLIKGDENAANAITVVAVQNGTDVPGAAKQVADLLKKQGFDAKSAGNASPHAGDGATENADAQVSETRIVYGKASVASRAQKIAQMLGGGKVVKEPKPTDVIGDDDDTDVTVVLGRDLAQTFIKRSAQR